MRIIAGPCLYESFTQSLNIADHCSRVCSKYGFEYYFKASYDKANRSSYKSIRSEIDFKDFRLNFADMQYQGHKTLTDVHDVSQVSKISDVVNVIQIPAFLCRQTDLIEEAAECSKILNIKKGQFLAPWDIGNIIDKVRNVNPNCEVWITERGTSFGYNRLVVDFTGMQYIMDNYDVPLIFDATHSAQQPGGEGTKSGGNREYAKSLAYAAAGMGVQNFFMEVHPDPDNAPSDGPNMIRLEDFEEVTHRISKLIRS
jgi:2-dehydro-3-deoxyphosphooctonate aldolase (KDO 8-P synthase)